MKKKYTSTIILLCFALLAFPCTGIAAVISYVKSKKGIVVTLDKGIMEIRICKADLVEIKYTVLDKLPDHSSLVVNNRWRDDVNFKVVDSPNELILTTEKLIVSVNKNTNGITYKNKTGRVVLAESPRNKEMTKSVVAGIKTYSCLTEFESPSGEGLYGLGCHPEDTLSINYKGRDQQMLIKYMTGAIPVMLSTKGYGLLWDNYSASEFYGAEASNTRYKYVSESGDVIDYYFFLGPDFDHIVDLYRQATGKAPMYPKWVFGLFQSQDRYKTQEEIIRVKNQYRSNHIPVDAIVQDWYWWSPLPIGSHVMSKERYPDPAKMVNELHKDHIKAMISIWPVFGSGTKDFAALKDRGFLTSITWDNFVTHTFDTYYDAHNPLARQLYWQQARDSVVKRYGWDAWWVDQCEPDNGSLLDERRKAIFSVGRGIDYFNTYALEHAKGLYKGWREDIPGKRAFFLVRQAFAGSQRTATTLWSSDVTTTFRALKSQVPQGLNACASGIPYWTSDIGGYISRTSPDGIPNWKDKDKRELFTRWFQFGTFCPIMRIHGKGERALYSDNWDESTKSILLNYDRLRYRLLPYIYSLSAMVTGQNYTIMRALTFDFRNDARVYNIQDQYMFGPAFLVCPVTDPLFATVTQQSAVSTKTVYLPAEATWYDFWTGQKFTGGQNIQTPINIENIPVFVRAGSIVPMSGNIEYATQKTTAPIEIRIYPGANGRFTFYEDENDNYNYEKGKSARFTITWDDKHRQLMISNRIGSFKGMDKVKKFALILVRQDHGTGVVVPKSADHLLSYSGQAVSVKL